jgi:uncharacterized protein (DUF2147 family)
MIGTARSARRLAGCIGAVIAGVALLTGESRAATPPDIAGTWFTQDGEGAIEILPCGGERCGRIAWMKNPVDEHGRPPTDRNNPDPALRQRPICGLTIVTGLKPQDDGSWGQGRVYNPDDARTYDMEIRRASPDALKVTGYLGFRFLGQTTEWRRAPKNLVRCQQPSSRGSEANPGTASQ